jgi:hypothetical protein
VLSEAIVAEDSCADDAGPLLADRRSLSLLERKEFDFQDLDQQMRGGDEVIRRAKRFSIRFQWEYLPRSLNPSASVYI